MKRSSQLLGAALAGALGAAGVASCQIVAGLDGDFRPAPDAGGAIDAGDAGTHETGPPGCQEATYPDPPGGMDDGVAIAPIVVAVHSVDLGDMSVVPGYDLDHVCTCIADAGPTCVGRSMNPATYCDAPGGVDNAFAKLLQLIEVPLGSSFSSMAFSTKADAGYWTFLVEVKRYNGTPNDPSVDVAMYPCPGLGTTPKWDGSDSWPILDTSVTSMGAPVYKSNGAYVAGGTLVATVTAVPITLGGVKQTISLTLSGAVLTGKLVKSNGSWRLIQGVLAARMALTDLFKTMSSYRDTSAKPLCTDSGFLYSTLKSSFCTNADIALDGMQPKSAPCDAVSFGMGFTADPAVRGPQVPAPAPAPGCPPATDPANDSCGP